MRACRILPTTARSALPALAIGLAVFCARPVLAESIDVAVRGETVVVGRDLVLELRLPAAAGSDAAAVTVAVAAAATDAAGARGDGPALLEEALPLRPDDAAGRFVWTAPTRPDARPGTYNLTVTVTSPVGEHRWQGQVTVGFGSEWTAGRITHFIAERGLLLFLLVVFAGGVLMSFTPCIYPMIPITLAVLGAQAQDRGVARSFVTALAYGLGLSLVFGAIGVVSALFFSGITAFLQSPAVLVPIALLMVWLSFAMFGAYELEAPAFLRNRLQGAGGHRAGLVGAFAAGLVAGLVASPCVGPFLAGLLLWVGSTGNLGLGFWSLFTFGLGLSALLVAVGTFPAFLTRLPRSGGWMETVKKGMGLLLLYMAFFFVRPPLVLSEPAFLLLLGAVTVLVAVFLGAFDRLAPESGWWPRTRKGLGLIGFLIGVWLLARVGLPELLPPRTTAGAGAPATTVAAVATAATGNGTNDPTAATPLPAEVPWTVLRAGENVGAQLEAAIAEAQATGRPVIIDFWATWCAYCRKLDREVWNVPEVVQESLRFTAIKIDATRPDDADMTAVKAMFRVPGLPTVAFVDSSGRILHGRTLSGWHEAAVFLTTMRGVP
jgi:thioredoxin:protein disulfide reductase